MEAPVVRCGNERNFLAIGRKSRLDIYGAFRSEPLSFRRLQIERPKLHRVIGVRAVNYPPAIWGTIRLIIIAGARSDLFGFRRLLALASRAFPPLSRSATCHRQSTPLRSARWSVAANTSRGNNTDAASRSASIPVRVAREEQCPLLSRQRRERCNVANMSPTLGFSWNKEANVLLSVFCNWQNQSRRMFTIRIDRYSCLLKT